MESTVTVSTPPAVEPVSVALAMRHCRVDGVQEQDLISLHLQVARQWVEQFLGRALITQQLLWTMSDRGGHGAWPGIPQVAWFAPAMLGFPSRLMRPLELPRAPVQSVASVTIRDCENADTVLDASTYSLDLALQPARLVMQPGWMCGPVRHVQVAFTAGYGDQPAAVPAGIQHAILLLTAFLYEHRGDSGGDMPAAVEHLLAPYRIAFFGG